MALSCSKGEAGASGWTFEYSIGYTTFQKKKHLNIVFAFLGHFPPGPLTNTIRHFLDILKLFANI